MATNEDIMDTLGIIQNHMIDVESALEDVKASRQEAVAMNEYDRNAVLKNISEFEMTLVNNIKDTIVQQQMELKSYHKDFNEKLISQNNKNRMDAEALYNKVERTARNVLDLNSTVRNTVNSGFEGLHLREEIEKIMKSSIKDSLEKQTKANEQAVIKLGNTAVQMRETFKNNIHAPFAYAGMGLIVLFFAVGFKCHEIYQKRICENVFEQFYSDRFNEEIAEPLKEAKIEADEEYMKRLQAYIENAKDEVSKSMEKILKRGITNMAEIKKLNRDELEKMSETERKNYYKKYIDSLLLEEKQIKRELVVKAKAKEIADRKKINHAMFLVAGELFTNLDVAVPFLKDLASKTRFTARHTEDLNLLMESKGLANVVKFIPCLETKKDKDKAKDEDKEKDNDEKSENVEETPSESKE